jgi:eukaryotic-like serine/threonine-protein kinase
MPLTPGQILNNRYRVITLLGQGGFGAVYRAWDINLESSRAVKENLETTPEAQRQFKREAQILDKLSHPNLPRVIDHFIIPHQGQYLVMDFVEGSDLREMLQHSGGPLPEAQVLEWIGQVCEALNYLHSQNPPVIHRDIKPANIKITPSGRAMLVDFGIAKVYDPNSATTRGAQAVSPGFSPVEQYGSGSHTDVRADVYALGATLYMLLTGRPPLDAVDRNMGARLPEPHTLNPQISVQVEKAILHALTLYPEQRTPTTAELRRELTEGRAGIRVAVPGSAAAGLYTPAAAAPASTGAAAAGKCAAHHQRPASHFGSALPGRGRC